MRILLLAGTALMLSALTAQASDLYAPINRQNARCGNVGPILSHIAVTLPAQPLCCPDAGKCTQYLSTTKIKLPHLDQVT